MSSESATFHLKSLSTTTVAGALSKLRLGGEVLRRVEKAKFFRP